MTPLLTQRLAPVLDLVRRLIGRGNKRGRPRPTRRLGTFLGVFTPTLLTILGVIMYLRFGWVVGHAGVAKTLLIVCLANGITFLTVLSLSAVATNGRVGVGGAYYIISRSLGVEIGGAIGLPLFLSQAFSVTLCAFGLAESLRIVWPGVPVPAAALVIIVAVAALAYRGASAALRSQLPIIGLIAVSLVALALGAFFGGGVSGPQVAGPSGQVGFWTVFAVFFPAVTGIMAGLGLSGDLEDPEKSIPLGSIGATLVGFVVYLTIPLLLSLGADAETLRDDPLVWARIAPLGAVLILPGLWGAIFSSAVGSILGAPRTLQALAMDHLAPRQLAAVAKEGGEPVLGLAVTLAIALGAVFLGDLNSVATVVTMFFLTVYGTVNLVAALEDLSGDPSWRPKLRVPWPVSLLGAVGCFGTMVLINPVASVVAVVAELALYLLLQRKERRADWGDARRGVYEALIRWALVKLSRRPLSARNWRPHVLVFTDDAERRLELVRFGSWFSQGRGVVTVCELQVGDVLDLELDRFKRQAEIDALLRREGIPAFGEVDVVSNIEDGIVAVAQANGMAAIESNTVLLGWPGDPRRLAELLRVIRRLERLRKSLVIGRVQAGTRLREDRSRTVDVWWGGLQRNGDLMLLLAYLLTRNPAWRRARIRVLSVASNELMKAETDRFLGRLLPELRITAEVRVFVKPADVGIRDLICAESASADVVLLGLATPPQGQDEEEYARRLFELVEGLPTVFFVKNASLFVGELVVPEGRPAGPRVPLPSVGAGA
ncbi:MAG: Na-K-Cl cotransporter [Deltaproteobacteria bacterium]|nr:Na-K-Cl cotransporter [Deltaproteobacteria bacterium]